MINRIRALVAIFLFGSAVLANSQSSHPLMDKRGMRDPTQTEKALQESFDRIFVPWKAKPDESSFTRFVINESHVAVNGVRFSGVSLQMPVDGSMKNFKVEFFIASGVKQGGVPYLRGFNFVSEEGQTSSTFQLEKRKADQAILDVYPDCSPVVTVFSPDDSLKPGKRYALWFGFDSVRPVELACKITQVETRPDLKMTGVLIKRSGKASTLDERLSRSKEYEEASHFPVQEEIPLGERGHSQIQIVEFDEENLWEGSPSAGFRVRVPDPLPGDFVCWIFDPDGSVYKMKGGRWTLDNRGISVNRLDLHREISLNSRFKRQFPKCTDKNLEGNRIKKEWLKPGSIIQVVFKKQRPENLRLGYSYNFTDGFDESPQNYLPTYFVDPSIR